MTAKDDGNNSHETKTKRRQQKNNDGTTTEDKKKNKKKNNKWHIDLSTKHTPRAHSQCAVQNGMSTCVFSFVLSNVLPSVYRFILLLLCAIDGYGPQWAPVLWSQCHIIRDARSAVSEVDHQRLPRAFS